jgi:hypothetical protein
MEIFSHHLLKSFFYLHDDLLFNHFKLTELKFALFKLLFIHSHVYHLFYPSVCHHFLPYDLIFLYHHVFILIFHHCEVCFIHLLSSVRDQLYFLHRHALQFIFYHVYHAFILYVNLLFYHQQYVKLVLYDHPHDASQFHFLYVLHFILCHGSFYRDLQFHL